MNMALINRYIALVVEPNKAESNLMRYINPDMKFKDTFQHFLDNYGSTTYHIEETETIKQDEAPVDAPRWIAHTSEEDR